MCSTLPNIDYLSSVLRKPRVYATGDADVHIMQEAVTVSEAYNTGKADEPIIVQTLY